MVTALFSHRVCHQMASVLCQPVNKNKKSCGLAWAARSSMPHHIKVDEHIFKCWTPLQKSRPTEVYKIVSQRMNKRGFHS